jgi:epoxyqueuosine reductase QueG
MDCLSAITQRRGELTEDEKNLMRTYNTAWGCDECQSACPYNRNPAMTPIEFFYRDRIDELTPEKLADMDKDAFSRRAFAWRGRAVLERNLAVLASNKD